MMCRARTTGAENLGPQSGARHGEGPRGAHAPDVLVSARSVVVDSEQARSLSIAASESESGVDIVSG
jgi:hypothetical protein